MPGRHEDHWPTAVVDGGGEPWPRLRAAVADQLARMAEGEVLEVLVRDRSTALAAARWCRRRGDPVLCYRVQAGVRQLRVRRGG